MRGGGKARLTQLEPSQWKHVKVRARTFSELGGNVEKREGERVATVGYEGR